MVFEIKVFLILAGTPIFVFTASLLHLVSGKAGVSLYFVASLIFSAPGLAAFIGALGDDSYEAGMVNTLLLFMGVIPTIVAVVLYCVGSLKLEEWPRPPEYVGLLMVVAGFALVRALGA